MSFYPKVSVIIPVYNGANYVGQAIESVLAQTYKNIEIVVVDDGSPDGGATRRAVERYAPRVRYIHQENRGVAGALNAGARAMTGEVFSWLSHDDMFVPDKTERQIAFWEKIGGGDVLIYSDYTNVDPDNKRLYDVEMDNAMLTKQPLLAVLRGAMNGCTIIFPRKIFDVVGYFDESLRFTQDYDFWDRVEDRFPLVHCPGKMVRQRLHPGQDSHKPASLDECNRLWLRLIDKRNSVKRSLISGSPLLFLRGMRDFIAQTPYIGALNGIDDRIASAVSDAKVSVVMDVAGASEGAERAVASLVNQTHRNLELVLVERAPGASDFPLLDWAGQRIAVARVESHGASRAEARNAGLAACSGDYIAFLSEDDAFVPNKIEAQLVAMQEAGALVSHTSFYVSCPEAGRGYSHIAAGAMSGRLYPQLISACPVRVETMMINALVRADGLRFEGDLESDDALVLIKLAQRYDFHGVADALGICQWRLDRAPLNLDRALDSMSKLQLALECDPVLGVERDALQRFNARFHGLKEEIRRQREAAASEPAFNETLLKRVFSAEPVLCDAHGIA